MEKLTKFLYLASISILRLLFHHVDYAGKGVYYYQLLPYFLGSTYEAPMQRLERTDDKMMPCHIHITVSLWYYFLTEGRCICLQVFICFVIVFRYCLYISSSCVSVSREVIMHYICRLSSFFHVFLLPSLLLPRLLLLSFHTVFSFHLYFTSHVSLLVLHFRLHFLILFHPSVQGNS